MDSHYMLKAKRKFEKKNYREAKRYALNADILHPESRLISIFVSVMEVLMAGEKQDWYEVLGCNESDNGSKLLQAYHELATPIRLSKDELVGAEEALEMLMVAYRNTTRAFWSGCSNCSLESLYPDDMMNEEVVCIRCGGRDRAQPLASGNLPKDCGSVPGCWSRPDASRVLAVNRAQVEEVVAANGGESKESEGRSLVLGLAAPRANMSQRQGRSVVPGLPARQAKKKQRQGRTLEAPQSDGSQMQDQSVVVALEAPGSKPSTSTKGRN